MAMLQLSPPIPLDTPRGRAWAHVLLDYGSEMDLLWCCFIAATGECWCFRNGNSRPPTRHVTGRDLPEPEKGGRGKTLTFGKGFDDWPSSIRLLLLALVSTFENECGQPQATGNDHRQSHENKKIAGKHSPGHLFYSGVKVSPPCL
jgi:hypothetical protein